MRSDITISANPPPSQPAARTRGPVFDIVDQASPPSAQNEAAGTGEFVGHRPRSPANAKYNSFEPRVFESNPAPDDTSLSAGHGVLRSISMA
jgi:hypothetical protein